MSAFEKHTSGAVIANFSDFEADLLRNLAQQIVELLRDGEPAPDEYADPLEALLDFSGPIDEPDDPVLLRLFPTAYAEDPEAAGEFRRYTEPALREGKVSHATRLIDTLEEAGLPFEVDDDGDHVMIDLELDESDALAWLMALNDIRLAIATRLGITEDDDEFWENLDEEDPRAQAHGVYEWTGWVQETLVAAIEQ